MKHLIIPIFYIVFLIAAFVGQVKCIIKMVECNWDPIGKAEIVYTIGTFSGAGPIIGYLNIKNK